jgi:hypothetical protein
LGQRIRERSLNRAELEGKRNELKVPDANAPDERQINTHLTDDQVRQCEAALRRLADVANRHKRAEPFSLDLAILHFENTYCEPKSDRPIAQLVPVFLQRLEKTLKRSPAYLRSVKNDLERLCCYPAEAPKFSARKQFKELPLAPEAFGNLKPHEFLTRQHAYVIMESLKWIPDGAPDDSEPVPVGNVRWNKARGVYHSFFAWMEAAPQCYVAKNPFADVETRPEDKKPIVRLTARQAAALMEDVMTYREGAMVPCFALLLFGGIRPSEKNSEIERLSKGGSAQVREQA